MWSGAEDMVVVGAFGFSQNTEDKSSRVGTRRGKRGHIIIATESKSTVILDLGRNSTNL